MVTRLTHGMTAKRFNEVPQSQRRAILMLVVTTCLFLRMMPARGWQARERRRQGGDGTERVHLSSTPPTADYS
jgi:hypothetical protein